MATLAFKIDYDWLTDTLRTFWGEHKYQSINAIQKDWGLDDTTLEALLFGKLKLVEDCPDQNTGVLVEDNWTPPPYYPKERQTVSHKQGVLAYLRKNVLFSENEAYWTTLCYNLELDYLLSFSYRKEYPVKGDFDYLLGYVDGEGNFYGCSAWEHVILRKHLKKFVDLDSLHLIKGHRDIYLIPNRDSLTPKAIETLQALREVIKNHPDHNLDFGWDLVPD